MELRDVCQRRLLGPGQPKLAAHLQRHGRRVVVLLPIRSDGMPGRTHHPRHARRDRSNTAPRLSDHRP